MLIVSVFFYISDTSAQGGCCSWHGGVCGCDENSGRQICCDGSYSPSCLCRISSHISKPIRYIPFPDKDLKLKNVFLKNNGDETYDVWFDWDDANNEPFREYSVRLGPTHADPGPLVDVEESVYIFPKVKAGTYVFSLKTKVGGQWSDYVYWDNIEIPGEYEVYTPPTRASLEKDVQSKKEKIAKKEKRIRELKKEKFNLKSYFFFERIFWIIVVSILAFQYRKNKLLKDSREY